MAPQNPKPLTRSKAWACAAMNQLAFPGLGTVMAGRRVGYVQAAIMLVGFLLAMGFMLWFIVCSARYLATSTGQEGDYLAQFRPYAWIGLLGLGLCAIAWCWALVSSIQLVCQSQQRPPVFPLT